MNPVLAFYIVMAVLGAVLPMSQFIPWFLDHGFDAHLFVSELFSTRIGGFFGWDVIVSTIVLIAFILIEGRRLQMTALWVPIMCGLTAGVSFGLPVFLAMREHKKR